MQLDSLIRSLDTIHFIVWSLCLQQDFILPNHYKNKTGIS